MASIGRIAIAAASVAQEATVTLSNINFDFSLVRLEAPLEYRHMGAVLSSKRKREAEDGSTHITARKLAALFAVDLPPIPNLTRAYGLRASEIVENPRFNPRSSPSHGPFVDYVGADGTSIWAAATSGPGAVAVHLLACLLARMWSGPEATSIWSELVAARKTLLQGRLQEQEFPISTVTASQIEIERHRLIEWDGSARSWIRTADSAKRTQQTQMMLMIDNMDLPIPHKVSVYNDVMHTWIQALTVVEKLVSGVAQSVTTGEALLGLSAWHIYPDLCVTGQRTTFVEQKDHLVTKGGIVTLGLQEHRDRDPTGILWSMPLAHLRYYGGAVSTQRTLSSKSSKVSFDRIVLVAMGSAMTVWIHPDSEIKSAMRFFIAYSDLYDFGQAVESKRLLWPKMLAEQARKVLSADQAEFQDMARLIDLGRRRYGGFLAPDKEHPRAFFGLTDPNWCIRLLYLPDQAIFTMRSMVKFLPVNLDYAFIRHAHPNLNEFSMIEYASISQIRASGGFVYHRWITMPEGCWDNDCFSMVLDRARYIKEVLGELCGLIEHEELFCEICPAGDAGAMSSFFPRVIARGHDKSLAFWSNLEFRCTMKEERECVMWLKKDHINILSALEDLYRRLDYESLLGNDDSRIHLYVRRQPGLNWSQIKLPVDFVTKALETQIEELPHTSTYFDQPLPVYLELEKELYHNSLDNLAAAQTVFKKLPNAEIDLAVISRCLSEAKWAKDHNPFDDVLMSRASTVACICMFESGELDLDPEDLEDVVAVSSSNNLYASEVLSCDPSDCPPPYAFRHVIGNIGRPGLVLLLSPRKTMLREPDLESWEMVNHAPFDGKFEDNFASTSLHLSLTGYEQPVNINDHGDRDSVVHFAEAVVSAHDRGVWHADLDLLRLTKRTWSRISPGDCPHHGGDRADYSLVADLISIDSWYEVLDPPRTPAVVRSQSNWIARLALASIPLPEKHELAITSGTPCCACLDRHRSQVAQRNKNAVFLC